MKHPGSSWVPVKFSTEISFSGRTAGARENWLCSSHLLFKTPEQARANHNPEKARMFDKLSNDFAEGLKGLR